MKYIQTSDEGKKKKKEEPFPHSWHLGPYWVFQVKSWVGNWFTTSLEMPKSYDSSRSGKGRFGAVCTLSGINSLLHDETSSQLSRNSLGTQKCSIVFSLQVEVLYPAMNSNSYENEQTKQQAISLPKLNSIGQVLGMYEAMASFCSPLGQFHVRTQSHVTHRRAQKGQAGSWIQVLESEQFCIHQHLLLFWL